MMDYVEDQFSIGNMVDFWVVNGDDVFPTYVFPMTNAAGAADQPSI